MPTLIFILMLMMPVGPFASSRSGRPKTPPCVSGACSDNWTGTSGQTVPAHNTAWTDLNSSTPCSGYSLTGSGQVTALSSFASSGCLYTSSTAGTSSIVWEPTTGGNPDKRLFVRATPNVTDGYAIRPSLSSQNICFFKNGSLGSCVNGTVTSAAHTLVLTASGTTTVTLTITLDGTTFGTSTDSSSPIMSGHPGFVSYGNGVSTDSNYGAWKDHL